MNQVTELVSYATKQPALPGGITAMAYPLPRYEVVRKWGERFRYSRTLSCAIGVTAEQHAKLWRIGEESTTCARLALAGVEALIAAGPLDLPREGAARLMSSLADGLLGRGIDVNGDEGHAALRAASHTIQSCKTYLRMGQRPRVKYVLNIPVTIALPFRLRAGLAYGAPLVAEGGYLWIAPLGWVALPEGLPDGMARPVGEVSYAEYTHWGQTWRVRFVFVDESTPEQSAAAVLRRAAKAKATPPAIKIVEVTSGEVVEPAPKASAKAGKAPAAKVYPVPTAEELAALEKINAANRWRGVADWTWEQACDNPAFWR